MRTYLFVLAMAVALPLVVLLVLNTYRSFRHDAQQSGTAALNVAEIAAASVYTFIHDGQLALSRLALRPQIRAMDPARCDPMLTSFVELNPQFANAGIVNLAGQVICSGLPQPGDDQALITPTEHFQRLLREDSFVVGKPFVDAVTGKWVSALAHPVRDGQGRLTGIVGLVIDLERYALLLNAVDLPPDATVSIIDGDGAVISHSGDDQQWSGLRVRNSEIAGIALARKRGHAAAAGFDGTRRLYGFTPVLNTDWLVLVGVPETAVFAAVRSSIFQDGFSMMIVVLAVIGLAFFVGRHIEQPVRAMAATARKIAQGKLAARATVGGPREITEVATEFNRMLDFRDQIELVLQETERRFRSLLENVQMAAVILDGEGHIRFCNDYLLALTGWSRKQLLGEDWYARLVAPEDAHAREAFLQSLKQGEIAACHENPVVTRDGEKRMMRWNNTLLKDPAGNVSGVASLGEDITERLAAERRAMGEKQILEMAARGAAPEEILEALCANIAKQCRHGALCTVLLLDADGVHLRHGAAPGMPQGFVQAIDGSAIGPAAGSCGTAAFSRKPVIVSDIASDPLWRNWREIALNHGLRACWSTPIFSDKGAVLGTFALYFPQPLTPNTGELRLAESASHLAGIVIMRQQTEEALKDTSLRLRALSSRVLEVQESERRRIARELHDEIGQILTALKIHLQKLKPGSEPHVLGRGIDDCIDITARALDRVRSLTLDLRPPQLDYLGLDDAIRWHLEHQCAAAGINWRLDCEPGFPRLPSDLETTCFRIVQEALTNVVRHADAHQVTVGLFQQGDELRLAIRDDGHGFDVGDVARFSIEEGHMGVLGMHERAALAGGRLEISSDHSGTEVRAAFPLRSAAGDTGLQEGRK
ncbi:MAG: PAS domain S-box protein [Burkholderiales bacterium]